MIAVMIKDRPSSGKGEGKGKGRCHGVLTLRRSLVSMGHKGGARVFTYFT